MAQDNTTQKQPDRGNEDTTRKPDPETLGTTDPQEHMKGPLSSAVQKVREEVNEKGKETPKQMDTDKKK